jgi:hypothetical protein
LGGGKKGGGGVPLPLLIFFIFINKLSSQNRTKEIK